MYWRDWKKDHCTSNGKRQYSSQLMDIKGSWEDACARQPVDLNGQHWDRPDRCINNAGMWGEVDVIDSSCPNSRWGEWKKDHCTSNDKRQWSAVLHDIIGNWENECNKRPVHVNGLVWNKPDRCVNEGPGTKMWGEIDVPDVSCNPGRWMGDWFEDGFDVDKLILKRRVDDNGHKNWEAAADYLIKNNKLDIPSKYTNPTNPRAQNEGIAGMYVYVNVTGNESDGTDLSKKCFTSSTGEYGPYSFDIDNSIITLDTIVTLKAINWIGGANKYTFLKSSGGSLLTDDSVRVDGEPLNDVYQFKFTKEGCNLSLTPERRKIIAYGDKVQLKSVYNSKYAQCGGGTNAGAASIHGTCSLVDNSGICGDDKWQTFKITSASGKHGPICLGDKVRISQVVGDNEDITPAGGTAVWSTKHGTNDNAIIQLLPITGSLYENPVQEIKAYNDTVIDELCKRDPLNFQCTTNNVNSFFSSLGNSITVYIIAGIIALIILRKVLRWILM